MTVNLCPGMVRLACYAASQRLARQLLEEKSNGIVYPSVRRKGSAATCLACFRPALVYNPRRGQRFEITFTASKHGYEHKVVTLSGWPAGPSRQVIHPPALSVYSKRNHIIGICLRSRASRVVIILVLK